MSSSRSIFYERIDNCCLVNEHETLIKHDEKELLIMYLNVNRGYLRKLHVIRELIMNSRPDILYLSEVDMEQIHPEHLMITGYSFYTCRTKVGNKSKVRIISLVKDISFREVVHEKEWSDSRSEIWLTLTSMTGEKLIVAGTYREWSYETGASKVPGKDQEGFMNRVEAASKCKSIIVGDFNLDLNKKNRTSYVHRNRLMGFVNDVESFNMKICEPKHPTRRAVTRGNKLSTSKLDFAISTEDLHVGQVSMDAVSDHDMLYIKAPVVKEGHQTNTQVRDLRKVKSRVTRDAVKEGLKGWEELKDADALAEKIQSVCIEVLDKHHPFRASGRERKKGSVLRGYKWNKSLTQMSRQERAKGIKLLRLKHRRRMEEKYKCYLNANAEKNGDFWKLCKMMERSSNGIIKVNDKNNIPVPQSEIGNHFLREVFIDKLDVSKKKIEAAKREIGDEYVTPTAPLREGATLTDFKPVSKERVLLLIQSQKKSGSTDAFGLSSTVLKAWKMELYEPLTELLNISLRNGRFPTMWKLANIIPLFKGKGLSKTAGKSYRPISLLSPFARIIEKEVWSQIRDYLESNNLLHGGQFGYRKGKSTISCITEVDKKIRSAKRNNKHCAMLILDYSMAFDLITFQTIDMRLPGLGIAGMVREWLKSYMTNRRIMVTVNGKRSVIEDIGSSSPQGSSLSPGLYLIGSSDLGDYMAKNGFTYASFADDINIIVEEDTVENLKSSLERAYKVVARYSAWSNLCINATKTEYIHFFNQPDILPVINIEGNEIKQSKDCVFLGVRIDRNLTGKRHLQYLKDDSNKRIGALRGLKQWLPKATIKKLVYSKITSKLLYGSSIFLDASDPECQGMKIIRRLVNKACRVVLNLKRDCRWNSDRLLTMCGHPPVWRLAVQELVRECGRHDQTKSAYSRQSGEYNLRGGSLIRDYKDKSVHAKFERVHRALHKKVINNWKNTPAEVVGDKWQECATLLTEQKDMWRKMVG